MSKIILLTVQNFTFTGRNTKQLSINVPGSVLVYFKLENDEYCQDFDPIFKALTKKDGRVNYAVLDVAANKQVVNMSRETNTPIQGVPHLILYINGIARGR